MEIDKLSGKIASNQELVNEIYEDALQLSFRQLGKIGEDLLKFVALPFTFLGLTAEQLEEKYKIFIAHTVNKIPVEKRQAPKSAIVSPLLEHIKYLFDDEDAENLINMFSDLLANAINCDSKNSVHVSYVHTLLQLGAIEAEILKKIYEVDYEYDTLGIAFKRRLDREAGYVQVLSDEAEPLAGEEENVFFYYNLFIVDDGLKVPDDMFFEALSVLEHHNLISVFKINKFKDEDEYSLDKHDKHNVDKFDPYGAIWGYKLTQYGQNFMSVCVEPTTNIHSVFSCKYCGVVFRNVDRDGRCPSCGNVGDRL